jgi:transcriptional regulator with XRE-family HTH domain
MLSDNFVCMKIGDRIRKERMARGMTVRELGNKFEVSGAAVSQWENGGGITVRNRVNLSEALEIPIADLMPRSEGSSNRTAELSPQESVLLDRFRALDPKHREAYLHMLLVWPPPPD